MTAPATSSAPTKVLSTDQLFLFRPLFLFLLLLITEIFWRIDKFVQKGYKNEDFSNFYNNLSNN